MKSRCICGLLSTLTPKEVIAVHLSRTRCSLDTYSFLKKVLQFCDGKPLVIGDKATWYPWAIKRLGLNFKHETFGERNAVEQWYSPFKHRVKRFWKRFPFHSSNHSILGWCLYLMQFFQRYGGALF